MCQTNHTAYNNEPTAKYYCNICDTSFSCKGFSTHLKKKHDVKFVDYVKSNLELFIEFGWHLCQICNDTPTQSPSCSKKCVKLLQSKQRTGRILNFTPEQREEKNKNISKSKKGKRLGINPRESLSPEQVSEWKQKISESHKGKRTGRNLWDEMDEETSKNARKAIGLASSARMSGEGNVMFGKKHSAETLRKIFKHRKITDIEQIIYDFLTKNSIGFKFQYFVNFDSKYLYDFKINEIPLIIEADGDYYHGGPGCKKWHSNVEECKLNDKVKDELASKHNIKVLRFWGSEITKNSEYVFKTILNEINIMSENKCQ